jgi:hypothetical protein
MPQKATAVGVPDLARVPVVGVVAVAATSGAAVGLVVGAVGAAVVQLVVEAGSEGAR